VSNTISLSKVQLYVNFYNYKMKPQDPYLLLPNFGFLPTPRIQKTLEHTTQFARNDTRVPLCMHFQSRFPAANVSRLNEVVTADIPANDDGIMGHVSTKMPKLFCGCTSLLHAVYHMRSESNMYVTLEDFIRKYGVLFFSDNAKAKTGQGVHEIPQLSVIKDFQCEPHHQHQIFAERRIQEVKKIANLLLDNTGDPPNLMASMYQTCCLHP
jgi:hypothetical protein